MFQERRDILVHQLKGLKMTTDLKFFICVQQASLWFVLLLTELTRSVWTGMFSLPSHIPPRPVSRTNWLSAACVDISSAVLCGGRVADTLTPPPTSPSPTIASSTSSSSGLSLSPTSSLWPAATCCWPCWTFQSMRGLTKHTEQRNSDDYKWFFALICLVGYWMTNTYNYKKKYSRLSVEYWKPVIFFH